MSIDSSIASQQLALQQAIAAQVNSSAVGTTEITNFQNAMAALEASMQNCATDAVNGPVSNEHLQVMLEDLANVNSTLATLQNDAKTNTTDAAFLNQASIQTSVAALNDTSVGGKSLATIGTDASASELQTFYQDSVTGSYGHETMSQDYMNIFNGISGAASNGAK